MISEKNDMAISILAKENDLENVIDVINYQDEEKLGKGKEMVDKITSIITIFKNPFLDFIKTVPKVMIYLVMLMNIYFREL